MNGLYVRPLDTYAECGQDLKACKREITQVFCPWKALFCARANDRKMYRCALYFYSQIILIFLSAFYFCMCYASI